MDDHRPARRECAKLLIGGLLAGAATALQGCRRESAAFSCIGTAEGGAAELGEADKKTRQSLRYVEKGPPTDRTCERCVQFLPASSGCGQCRLMKGPIHPQATCLAWASR